MSFSNITIKRTSNSPNLRRRHRQNRRPQLATPKTHINPQHGCLNTMTHHPDKSAEYAFQNEIVDYLKGNGWLVGSASKYNRELALYVEDALAFVKESQPDQWEKYCGIYPTNTEEKFLERVATQLNKADPNAANDSGLAVEIVICHHEQQGCGLR